MKHFKSQLGSRPLSLVVVCLVIVSLLASLSPRPASALDPATTATASPVKAAADSSTVTPSAVPTPTIQETATPVDTPAPTDTAVPTEPPAPTDTATPADTPTPTDTATPTPTTLPTDTPTVLPTDTPAATPTDVPTPVPTETATPTPTETATPVPTDTATPTPTDTVTPVPTETATPTPTTIPDPHVSLSIAPEASTVSAGGEAGYTVMLENTGEVTATVDLAVSDSQPVDFASALDATSFDLAPGDQTSTGLTVAAAATAAGGASNVSSVTASFGVSSITASATTTVDSTFALSLSLSPDTVLAKPGEAASYSASVTNSGNAAEDVNIQYENSDQLNFSYDQSVTTLSLAPGDTQTFSFAVTPAEGALAGAESTTKVTVSGAVHADVTASGTVVTTVAPSGKPAISIEPPHSLTAAGDTAVYTATITNMGNVSDTFNLTMDNSDPAHFSVVATPSMFQLEPSAVATATITVGVAADTPSGSIGTSTATIDSAADQSATASATFSTEVFRLDFTRVLSGTQVEQHNVPEMKLIGIEIGVKAPIDLPVSALTDYIPSSWTVTDPGEGTVETIDGLTQKITWPVEGIMAGQVITRYYELVSPELTSPPRGYDFVSEVKLADRGVESEPWAIAVDVANPTHYLHTADTATSADDFDTLNTNRPSGPAAASVARSPGGNIYSSLEGSSGTSFFSTRRVPAGKQWNISGTWSFYTYLKADSAVRLKATEVRLFRVYPDGDIAPVYTGKKDVNQDLTTDYKLFAWNQDVPDRTVIGPEEWLLVEFLVQTEQPARVQLGLDTMAVPSRVDVQLREEPAPGNLNESDFRIGYDTPLSSMAWYSATDQPAPGLRRGEGFRVRFAVFNNGSQAKNWQPRLEYYQDGKGWAPVPTNTGGAPFYVSDTPHYSNEVAIQIGDLALGKSRGAAQPGRAYDASNPGGAFSLSPLSYTEIEFNLQPTTAAVDYKLYVFRLTDDGAPFYRFPKEAGASVWQETAPATSPETLSATALAAHDQGGPHLDYGEDTAKCAACHRTHTGAGAELRAKGPEEEKLCFSCHDGTGASTDIYSEFQKSERHPVQATMGAHQAYEAGDYGWLPSGQRHIECEDCHSPHGVTAGNSTIGIGDFPNVIKNVWGVTVTNPDANFTTLGQANFSRTETPTTEYQVCIKCHSSYGFDSLPPASPSGGFATTDVAKEFNVNNQSYHWVETDKTAITSPTPRTDSYERYMAFTPGSGMQKNTQMNCTDCHTSEQPSLPNGPHGSNAPFMLRGTWNRTEYGNCLRCHDPAVYGPTGDKNRTGATGFGGEEASNLHAYHLSETGHVSGCQDCHSAIPHGWSKRALLVTTGDPAPYNNGSKLMSFRLPSSTGNWSEENCSTASGCH